MFTFAHCRSRLSGAVFDIFPPLPPFVSPFLLLLAAVTSIPSSHSFLSSLVTSENGRGGGGGVVGGYNHPGICVPIISGLAV